MSRDVFGTGVVVTVIAARPIFADFLRSAVACHRPGYRGSLLPLGGGKPPQAKGGGKPPHSEVKAPGAKSPSGTPPQDKTTTQRGRVRRSAGARTTPAVRNRALRRR